MALNEISPLLYRCLLLLFLFYVITAVAAMTAALLCVRTSDALFPAPLGSPQVQGYAADDYREDNYNDNVYHMISLFFRVA